MKNPLSNRAKKMALWFSAAALLWLGLSQIFGRFFQRTLLLGPTKLDASHRFVFEKPCEEIWLSACNGCSQINGVFFKTDSAQPARGAVLYFHGNRDDLQRWGHFQKAFTERGYDFFAIDYPGYGKSCGPQTESCFCDAALAAHDFLSKKWAAEKIVIWGRSLGSGIATDLASKRPAKALILETPFASIRSLELDQVPLLWLPKKLPFEFDNASKISKIKSPILVVHGTADRIVPLKNALRLRPFLKPSDEFSIIEGGAHKNLGHFPAYSEALDRWLLH